MEGSIYSLIPPGFGHNLCAVVKKGYFINYVGDRFFRADHS